MDPNVTALLSSLNHPMHTQINELRTLILTNRPGISEGIKWNGPNYQINDCDRMTIKVNPPKKVHLILHTGARSKAAYKDGMGHWHEDLLTWKGEDRVVIEFTDAADFNHKKGIFTRHYFEMAGTDFVILSLKHHPFEYLVVVNQISHLMLTVLFYNL